MECLHRHIAWLTDDGLKFKPVQGATQVSVPCGKCPACRANNASSWAVRAEHELQYVKQSCFITLTYDPEHCPEDYSLRPKDVQDFLKRLRITLERKGLGHIRSYFLCGEYGTLRGRPHYHLLIFGWCPADLQYHSKSYAGDSLYTSKLVERCWGKGFAPVGTVGDGAAAYVARYAKKADGHVAGRRVKPFFRASRNIPLSNGKQGAIGAQWYLDHWRDLRHGYISVVNRKGVRVKARIPEYYWRMLERDHPDLYERVKKARFDYAQQSHHGLYIVDGHDHNPTVCFDGTCRSVADRNQSMVDYFGFSRHEGLHVEAEYDILFLQSRFRLAQMAAAQDKSLTRLRRNIE